MKCMKNDKNYTIRIREDCVIREQDRVKQILERVSKIISNSYIGKRGKSK